MHGTTFYTKLRPGARQTKVPLSPLQAARAEEGRGVHSRTQCSLWDDSQAASNRTNKAEARPNVRLHVAMWFCHWMHLWVPPAVGFVG